MTERRVNVKTILKIRNIFFLIGNIYFLQEISCLQPFTKIQTRKATQRHVFHLLTSYLRHNYSQIIKIAFAINEHDAIFIILAQQIKIYRLCPVLNFNGFI